jgi:hypothetical protein
VALTEGGTKSTQEEFVGKSNVVIFLEFLDLLSMFFLKPCKAHNVKALEDVGSVGGVSENLDILLTGIIHKCETVVRRMSIEE